MFTSLLQVLTRLIPDYKPNLPPMERTYSGRLLEEMNNPLPKDQVRPHALVQSF